MTRHLTVLVSLAFAAGYAGAQFEARQWRYYQDLKGPAQPGVVALEVPAVVHARCQSRDLWDLRLVSDQTKEQPYVLRRPQDYAARTVSQPVQLRNLSFLPGVGPRFELARPTPAALVKAVTLESPAPDFCHRVRVEGSHDRRQWAVLRQEGTIFRFRGDTAAEGLRVSFPPSDFAYLRLTLNTRGKPFPLTGAVLAPEVRAARPLRQLPSHPMRVRWVPEEKITEVSLDLYQPWQPVEEVELQFQDRNVRRACLVQYRNTLEEAWQSGPAGQVVMRYRTRTYVGEQTRLQVQARARYLRLVVQNGDDAPLQISGMRAYTQPWMLVTQWQPGASWRLYFGHDEPVAPRYDLAEFLQREYPEQMRGERSWSIALVAQPVQSNPDFPWQGTPWTERHPWLIYLCLGLGVGVLVVVLGRTMRQVAG